MIIVSETSIAQLIKMMIEEDHTLTVQDIIDKFNISRSTIERIMSENDVKMDYRGRRMAISKDELKKRLEHLVKNTKMRRWEMAEELEVTPPTVANYIKILKKEGRIDKDFAFQRGGIFE